MQDEQINNLVERFLDGETTLAEEKQLYDYFSQNENVDESLLPYAEYFRDLVVNGVNAQRFIHGFKREAQRHRHTVTNRKNDETTITMVADDKKATRVYLLKYDDRAYHFSDATITIVIVPK